MELFRGHVLIREPFEKSGVHAMHKAYLDALRYRGGLLGLSSLLVGVAHQGAVTRYFDCGLDGLAIEQMVNIIHVPEEPRRDTVFIASDVLDALEQAQVWRLQEDRRKLSADDLFYGVRISNHPIVEKVMDQLRAQSLQSNPSCPREIHN